MFAAFAVLLAFASPGPGFTARVDNPWFPLRPGTTYVYRGVKDGEPVRDIVTVTHRIRKIRDAPCVVVSDRLYARGRLAERTTDWYSQDARGNVWYFGESTAELDANHHVTSTEGSWRRASTARSPAFSCPRVRASARRAGRSSTRATPKTTSRSSASS